MLSILLAFCSMTDCRSAVSSDGPGSESAAARVFPSDISRAGGVACELSAGQFGPTMFLVADIGQAHVPRLTSQEMAKARQIASYVRHPKTLRFGSISGKFVVMDATHGVCGNGLPYPILNMSCNAIYMPVDRPDQIGASTGGCGSKFNTPYPWASP